ncbi:hypothetical protein H6G89_15420 [Oscillatoria sp. FACHB-1407]|uniref:hypothetical protein n=1 Tax=Oscillatoria sp. FACHB-1407 TaxID=2692847 RepID=UPI0016870383|nr:hypothetical protein [Oscillatoria sp. FACHB-1407]MBD2462436.1 hypothetical protein [Oscillatoria sp. FACHB-1407]
MLSNWINHASDWNPQLSRELKSRFKARNVLMAIAISVLVQLGIIIFFYNQLPAEHGFSSYCVSDSRCPKDANGNFLVDWAAWWADMIQVLHWLLMYGLIVSGVFLLTADLYQEEHRGTLNFIRLSPQSAWTILSGKLLGVPSLLYVAVVAAVPFHIVVATAVNLPLWIVLSFYVVLAGGAFLGYSAALLNAFLSKLPGRVVGEHLGTIYALIISGFTALFLVPLYMLWNGYITWAPYVHFFLGDDAVTDASTYNSFIPHAFLLMNLAICSYWIWQALHRCFHQPGATIISKKQSYGLTLYVEILIIGFALFLSSKEQVNQLFSTIGAIAVLNVAVFLCLIALLSISRQNLVDWARYRHFEREAIASEVESPQRQRSWLRKRLPDRALLWDLVLGERSPAIVAIALNLLIFGIALLFVMGLGLNSWRAFSYAFAGAIITGNLIILYATLLQIALLFKPSNRPFGVVALVGTAMLAPFIGILGFSFDLPVLAQFLLLFTPVPWSVLSLSEGFSMSLIGTAILGQWLAIAMANIQLARQLKQLGQSSTRALLTE